MNLARKYFMSQHLSNLQLQRELREINEMSWSFHRSSIHYFQSTAFKHLLLTENLSVRGAKKFSRDAKGVRFLYRDHN